MCINATITYTSVVPILFTVSNTEMDIDECITFFK